MKSFYIALTFLLLFGIAASCGSTGDGRPYAPTPYYFAGHTSNLSDGSTPYRVYLIVSDPMSTIIDDDEWREQFTKPSRVWERVQLLGTQNVEDLDWVSSECGKEIHWELKDSDARPLILDYYAHLPLRTHEDINALMEFQVPAPSNMKLPKGWDPLEKPLPHQPTEDLFHGIRFGLEEPEGYVLSLLPEGARAMEIVDLTKYFTERNNGSDQHLSNLNSIGLPHDLPEEATVARALVSYLEDFNEQALRAYLEKNQPECLVQ